MDFAFVCTQFHQTVLTLWILYLLVRVDMQKLVLKWYSIFTKAPCLSLAIRLFVSYQDSRWWRGLTPLQRGIQCILQSQLTGLYLFNLAIKQINPPQKKPTACIVVPVKVEEVFFRSTIRILLELLNLRGNVKRVSCNNIQINKKKKIYIYIYIKQINCNEGDAEFMNVFAFVNNSFLRVETLRYRWISQEVYRDNISISSLSFFLSIFVSYIYIYIYILLHWCNGC